MMSLSTELGSGALIQHSQANIYGYVPTSGICALFIALYALSTILHIGQAIKTRTWYTLFTVVLCGISEVIGWGARFWSAKNILALTPFLMQISTTIFAPTFTAAANFIILGHIIKRVGPQYSRIHSFAYGPVFVSIDAVALVVQAVGGGIASSSPTLKAIQQPGTAPITSVASQSIVGGHIMLGGIVVQLAEILVSLALSAEFFWNYSKGRVVRDLPSVATTPETTATIREPGVTADSSGEVEKVTEADNVDRDSALEKSRRWSWKVDLAVDHQMSRKVAIMSWALAFSSLCLLIRAIYRTVELSDGWNGRIIETQLYFNVLDGAMVTLAMYTLNLFHPGFLLYEGNSE
ncbi:hypothetical protein DL93DRAFT_2233179 [Clavulina sp. PMI_390]|nr:hypothetical protein DL93DRAFT_2233179 [Clavulina sp. PMI_390]